MTEISECLIDGDTRPGCAVRVEHVEGQVALHVLAPGWDDPVCSVYLSPLEAGAISASLFAAGREAENYESPV